MSFDSFKPIETPASGKLQVLGIARISTKNQDEMSLDDQADMHKEFVHENYDHPFDYEPVATQAKGEWLDRDELEQIRAAINSGKYDLVIMEDLGRLLRGLEAVNFCKIAVDQNVRLIAINDGVDTLNDDWEEKAATASIRHARYVEETSRRIKQRKRARFVREGRALPCEIFGYLKNPGAKTEMDLVRDTSAEWIYDRIFAMLEGGASYAEVADWLNDNHVPVGPFCRLSRWTGQMVARLVHNSTVRWMLTQGVQHLAHHPGPLGAFFRRITNRKNRQVAVIATARKLVTIAYLMLKHNERYRHARPEVIHRKFNRLHHTAHEKLCPPAATMPQICRDEGLPPVRTFEELPAGERRVLRRTGPTAFARRVGPDRNM
jgi:hypothetical protein